MRTKADILRRRPLSSDDHEAVENIKQTMEREQVERDPLARRLDAAPLDDEPLSADDLEALEAAREDFAAGRVVSLEELRRELE
ncbi:MAG TPA: hypothetical protein VE972_09555 [Conexibacter sp.]|nr:hypothetical protein [Conexibacter sp.]